MQEGDRKVSGNEESVSAKLLNVCVKEVNMCQGKPPEAGYKGTLSPLEFLEEKLLYT